MDEKYVILLGDVGTGKSTIVEKLTGERGRASDSPTGSTRSSEIFRVPESNLIIADTPGSNPLENKLEHTIWIASAINYRPFSKIFIVVKTARRIDSVISNVRKYLQTVVKLPLDLVAVLVTHMDMVAWTEDEFSSTFEEELGISSVVFSSMDTTREALLRDMQGTCIKEHHFKVDSENFFKLFEIHNHHDRNILRSTNDEVKRYTALKKAFDKERKAYCGEELVDRLFEFEAHMTEEIIEAQKRICDVNNFTFSGDDAANEAAHVANMTQQLCAVLYFIRKECTAFQCVHSVSRSGRTVRGCTCGIRMLPPSANAFERSLDAKLDAAKSGLVLRKLPPL